ncbi:patatin [Stylonychia lemnae]|uniref:Patatin n=1 Tax=Stylonychia lemnae TaxID=5949 RepID=A0A078B146_STYLE|nr:patatin [Stylonychia lemnae]|eukprot:CDW88051.1 patatin [Stylonychia lemnae]
MKINSVLSTAVAINLWLAISSVNCQSAGSPNVQAAQNDEEIWNVLSLDGGGIRGIITATVVDYMEKYAYTYSSKYCLPKRESKKVSMAELFDMVSGTSTGSLLASSLVLPNPDKNSPQINKFFASDALKIYTEFAPEVFQKYQLPRIWRIVGSLGFAIVGGIIFFFVGLKLLTDTQFESAIKAFKEFAKVKKQNHDKTLDAQEIVMEATLFMNVSIKIKDIKNGEALKKQISEGDLDQIQSAREEIRDHEAQYLERKGFKYLFLVLGFFFFGGIGYILMPKMHALTHSNYDRRGIEGLVTKLFGYVPIQDALTPEVCIIAYEYNTHEPRIFSKFTAKTNPETFNVSIGNASEASSAAPLYFDPKVIGDQVLIDGGVIANNPSLYAYLHSRYANQKENIRFVSIGTGMTLPKPMKKEELTKVDWFMEIGNLLTTVEQLTHEYLMRKLSKENYRFQALMDRDLALDSYSDENIEELTSYGDKTILKYQSQIQEAVNRVVDQKFSKKYSCSKP